MKKTEEQPLMIRTKDKLIELFQTVDWDKITISLKNSGHNLTITPVAQGVIKTIDDVELFLVDGSPLKTLNKTSLDQLIANLINYDQLLRNYEEQKKVLFQQFKQIQKLSEQTDFVLRESEDFQLYSDRHEELFGVRPDGISFNQGRL